MGELDGGLMSARIRWGDVEDRDVHPFDVPAIRHTDRVDLSAPVTFFVGENGSGKSSLLEAIVTAAGVNPEGGTRNLRFSNRPTESDLHRHVELHWRTRPSWAFFLRAETFFDMATAYEEAEERGLHERSHGQQFLHAANEKLSPGGLHFMDEPEAALSVTGQLSMLRRIHDVQAEEGQFVIATHSPILLAYPGAVIYEFTDAGLERVAYEDAQPVRLTKSFLDDPDRFFHHLLADD
ncbi:MAG TPA: AAA family ATPase [Acidimicrobiales bacterium]|nr:AAA family ATPase [Acidimicrobiales bacterium]